MKIKIPILSALFGCFLFYTVSMIRTPQKGWASEGNFTLVSMEPRMFGRYYCVFRVTKDAPNPSFVLHTTIRPSVYSGMNDKTVPVMGKPYPKRTIPLKLGQRYRIVFDWQSTVFDIEPR